jgi:hypothetical protein
LTKRSLIFIVLICIQLGFVNTAGQTSENGGDPFWEEGVFTIGNEQGNFSSLLASESYTHPSLVPLIDPEFIDVVVGVEDGLMQVFFNNEDTLSKFDLRKDNETFFSKQPYRHGAPHGVDIDNDGDTDILVGMESGNIDLYISNGVGGFTLNNSLIEGIKVDSYSKPTSVDLNGDNMTDILVGNGDGNLIAYFQDETEDGITWTENSQLFLRESVGSRASPTVIDPDSDGHFDIIVGSENLGISYIRNNGPDENSEFGTYEQIPFSNRGNPFFILDFLVQKPFLTPLLEDLNEDGFPDLIVGTQFNGISYFINHGIDMAKVEFQEDEGITFVQIMIVILLIALSVGVTVFIVRKRLEPTGDPIFLMLLHSIGIAPYQYKFTEEMDVDIILAGGAFVGIQNIVSEITGAPDLKTIESGDNKILITRYPFPNIETEIQILVWSSNEDSRMRVASKNLAIWIANNFESDFDKGMFGEEFEEQVTSQVKLQFSEWIA